MELHVGIQVWPPEKVTCEQRPGSCVTRVLDREQHMPASSLAESRTSLQPPCSSLLEDTARIVMGP